MSTLVYPDYTITSDTERRQQIVELTLCPKCRHDTLSNVVLINAEDKVWSVCDHCREQFWVKFDATKDVLPS